MLSKDNLVKIYLQQVLAQWKNKCSPMGVKVGENTVRSLLFADDQLLMAEDYEDLE